MDKMMDASISYIHNDPASFMSKFIPSMLALIGMKKDIERRMIKQNFSQKAASIPNSLQKKSEFFEKDKNGFRIWTIKPKQHVSKNTILYLHGGAYIFNIAKYHWNLIEELLYKTNATIVVPEYPLAPGANCTDVYDFIGAVYHDYFAELHSRDIVFMGDSAGGGIALGFAQELRNQNKTQPSQIILISPWLDITMSNPEMIIVDKKDKILGINGLLMAGLAYAGSLDPKDHKVSPIYGKFSGLGKISVFIGTHDLFIADARKLKSQLNQENIPINYFEYPQMFHVWPIITSLKESQHAIGQMSALIKKEY